MMFFCLYCRIWLWLSKTNFNNESDYQNYINDITSKSLYKSPIKVNSNDKIVTLSTCTYEFDDARMVIHGRLI